VLVEAPAADQERLRVAADRLASYDWVVVASVRSVSVLRDIRQDAWPARVRTAAVGRATARALTEAGAVSPVVARTAGADALWAVLEPLDTWQDRRVLLLTTPGGRTTLIDGLSAAGACVEAVEAYRMIPRDVDRIRQDWTRGAPDAVILASPRAADVLVDAVGREAVTALRAVVAIGETTARRLDELGVACLVAPEASFETAADALARLVTTPDRTRPSQRADAS
jgi:uroporphyrinogen-III synthase